MTKANKAAPIYLVAHGKHDQDLEEYEPPPIGLLYVGQALVDAGYRVRIIYLHGDGDRSLEKAVDDERPLFVGFSNFIYPYLRHDVLLSRLMKDRGIKVVWGGIFSTTLPEVALASDCVDYVVVGEGETPAPVLAQAIENDELPRGIPGVGFKDGDEIVITPPEPQAEDLDQFRFGLDLVDYRRYIQEVKSMNVRVARIPFSRGCPFRCNFCYNTLNPNRQVCRVHSHEYMLDLVERLKKEFGVNCVALVSDNPFGALNKAKKSLAGLGVSLMTSLHIQSISDDFLDWAEENNLVRIGFGLESGSDRVLHEVLGKTFDQETMMEGLRLCRERGIVTQSSWMGPIPGERPEELRMTIERIEEIWKQDRGHGITFNLFRLYPKTPIWDMALELGHEEPNDLDGWATYQPEAYPLLGYSDRRAARLKTLIMTLYPLNRALDQRLPGPIRTLLRSRLMRGRLAGPVEEMAWAGWQVIKAARKITGR